MAAHAEVCALAISQLIGHHRCECFRTKEPYAIYLTVTEEEPRKTQIVVEHRPKPGAAGFVGHILRPFCVPDEIFRAFEALAKA